MGIDFPLAKAYTPLSKETETSREATNMKTTTDNQPMTYEEAVAAGQKLNDEAAATQGREELTVTTSKGGRWSVDGGLVIF